MQTSSPLIADRSQDPRGVAEAVVPRRVPLLAILLLNVLASGLCVFLLGHVQSAMLTGVQAWGLAAWSAGIVVLLAAASTFVWRLRSSGIERQQTVQALLADATENENRLRGLYESSPAMLHASDMEGCLTMVSDAWLAKLGYSRENVLGRQGVEFFTEASRRFAIDVGMPTLLDQGRYDELEYQMLTSAGDPIDVLISAMLERGPDGRPLRVVAGLQDITERRRSEERLRESKAFLDSAGRIAGVGGWMLDLVSNEIEWTDETCRIHEVPSGHKPTLQQALDFYAPDARPKLRHAVETSIADGAPWDLELALVTAAGRPIWVRATGQVETHEGKAVRLIGALQDITERRALDAELRAKNELMSSILENLPCGLSVFNGALELVAYNGEYRRIGAYPDWLFECTPPRLEDFIRFNVTRGEYGDVDVEATVTAVIKGARSPSMPVRFEREIPGRIPVDVQSVPMPSGGFVTTCTDITERKRAERASQQQARLMRLVIDSFPGPLAHWDTDMRCTIANRAYFDWLHATPEQMIGRTQRELIPFREQGAELYASNEPLMLAALRGESQRVERSRVLDDGSTQHYRVDYLPDRDGDLIRGFISVVVDISDMKRAQLQLQDRTAQAEQASVAKSQFLANMSHEIRTPMNAILGMLALLKRTELTARQSDYVGKTEGAGRSLLGLLNDILDFSKAEAGKMTLEAHPFRMDQLLRDLAVILSSNAEHKDIEVLFDIDPKLPRALTGDAMRLLQVLINLGGNAIKFTQQGEVVVSVEVVASGDAGVTLQFSVRDSGIGIAPEHREIVFSGFSQAEASITRRFGGTGLGLAICRRLVELMGGALQVESTLGQGSRFYFQIDLPPAPEAADDESHAVGRALVSMRVLIVDDNPSARDVAKRMATTLGWSAEVADSGEAALAELQHASAPYDAVFVDCQMPGLDGWQTARRIRDMPAPASAATIVMVTAHGRETLVRRPPAEQALIDGFLVKPVTASMFYDAMADARSGGAPGAAPAHASPEPQLRLAGLRLLVAEDNANNQQVARELLEHEGADVVIAANGLEAVEAVAAADPPFHAVLMDLQMPMMDGYTATSRIRQDLAQAALPIVAMTANAMASDRQACLSAGMNDHVGKPFDLDHLVAVLLRLCGATVAPASGSGASNRGGSLAESVLSAAKAGDVAIEKAIRRLGGHLKVYERTLRDFVRDLDPMSARLAANALRAEWVEASRELHSVKGVAATVGAMALADRAGEAERMLLAAPSEEAALVVQRMTAFIESAVAPLQALCTALQAEAEAATVAATSPDAMPAADIDALAGLLAGVSQMLAASDLEAIEAVKALRTRLPSAAGTRLDALEDIVQSLDFDAALACCNDWLKECTS